MMIGSGILFICIGIVIVVSIAGLLIFVFRGNWNQKLSGSNYSGDSHSSAVIWGSSDTNDSSSGNNSREDNSSGFDGGDIGGGFGDSGGDSGGGDGGGGGE